MQEHSKLFVNLSASQTRKRLRGFGFGVRRVEAVGRNQAVILHTATGAHLRELEALFQAGNSPIRDPKAGREVEASDVLEDLPNIGRKSAEWLRSVGVSTRSQLSAMGPVGAYQLVASRHKVSRNLLWSLAAALKRKDWRQLTAAEKRELLAQLDD